MSRGRVTESLLAMLAVAVVVAPLHSLFTPGTWIPYALVMALAVTITGVVARSLTRLDVPVVLAQILVGLAITCLVFAREHLWYGLPTWETVLALNTLLYDARIIITTYAPPAPTSTGIILALALLVWLTTLVVDFLAVTRRAPALAGIALLTAFLTAASNSGSGMPVGYFIVAATLWLALLGRSRVQALTRWDSSGRHASQTPQPGHDRAGRLAVAGRQVGVISVLVAALAASLLPHMPTRFLLDGLGRASGGGGTPTMTISSTVNLADNLEQQSQHQVLRYTTSARSPAPLRVGVLPTYEDGVWTIGEPTTTTAALPDLPVGSSAEDAETFEVIENGLGAPQLALPFPVASLEIDTEWGTTTGDTIVVERRVDEDSASYVLEVPTEEALQDSPATDSLARPDVNPRDLAVDPASRGAVVEALASISAPGMTPIDKARAIQAHLRSNEYTYSLELLQPTDVTGAPVMTDPITAFLQTRQGFCTQFTAAMVMMARAEGIPARFAIGFLPGESDDDEWSVVGADAHAWPELYFADIGWLRFEPTPATRTGASPPAYSRPVSTTPTPEPTVRPSQPAQPVEPFEPPQPENRPTSATPTSWFADAIDRFGWLALVLVLAVLAALTMPLSAWVERRRRRRAAADEAARIEVVWGDLLERLDDIDITPPPDASPRQVGRYIIGQTYLSTPTRDALSRVVAAVETARYARPVEGSDPERVARVEEDAREVAERIVGALRRSDRVRSTWWPAAGVAAWRRGIDQGRDRLQTDVIDRLPRRRGSPPD